MRSFLNALVCALGATLLAGTAGADESPWPTPTAESRPWTRWWWLGSAVDKENIRQELQELHRAGIGGVEITCIYGVDGEEQNERPYRSEAWVEAVQYAIEQAELLGMGVDLPPGSGWRMGGPDLPRELGNSRLALKTFDVQAGESARLKLDRHTLQAAVAVAADGQRTNFTDQIKDNQLEWTPASDAKVYLSGYRWAGDRVKRPAPGGAGVNINPFWRQSSGAFLDDFRRTMQQLSGVRASFHDSFEYEGDWQPDFFAEFAKRRGYRLETYLPELSGAGDRDLVARVKCDYRETLSDLVRDDLVRPWAEWSHSLGLLARNQAHGSPGNWLDLYAASDIPETESFGRLVGDDSDPLIMKFASSASNVAGKRLTASESATWLGEHFTVSLDVLKRLLDRQLAAGVNHAVYHGTAYSPERAAWPGWLFYASTQVNDRNPIWRDLPALNTYLTRCQGLLQQSAPDNDVLLYWPLHDYWTNDSGLRADVRVHNSKRWLFGRPFGDAAEFLDRHGYGFDYISDALLRDAQPADGRIQMPGGDYRVILVPAAKHMPLATLQKLAQLSKSGVQVVCWKNLPESPPGLQGLTPPAAWNEAAAALASTPSVTTGDQLESLLAGSAARRYQTPASLLTLRRSLDGTPLVFLNNATDKAYDGWAPSPDGAQEVTLLAPMTGQTGRAEIRPAANGGREFRLQLEPGESLFARAGTHAQQNWTYQEATNETITLAGPAELEFIAGGPALPASRKLESADYWTALNDESANRFAGAARYTIHFALDDPDGRWLLDLGEASGSVRVTINDGAPQTLLGPSYRVFANNLKSGDNVMSVEVTGVAANRIRDLDRRGVRWRIFKDINLVNSRYKPFDASDWPIESQGLRGPMKLHRM